MRHRGYCWSVISVSQGLQRPRTLWPAAVTGTAVSSVVKATLHNRRGDPADPSVNTWTGCVVWPGARGSFVTITPFPVKRHDYLHGPQSRFLIKLYETSLSEIEILHAGAVLRAIILQATGTVFITRRQILIESIWDLRGLRHSPGWWGGAHGFTWLGASVSPSVKWGVLGTPSV